MRNGNGSRPNGNPSDNSARTGGNSGRKDENSARKPARLYARFSPRKNAMECESVEHQLADLRDWCARQGYMVMGEYRDEALSGGDYERPGLWDAVAALRPGETLLVRSLDRLARDVYLVEVLVRKVAKMRAKIVALQNGDLSADDPDAVMIRQILAAIAERQRKVTAALTRAAMRRKQADGKRMGRADRAPYGWMPDPANGKRLVPVDEEIAVIRRMMDLHRRRVRPATIASILNREGVMTRIGREWRGGSISRIIRRQTD